MTINVAPTRISMSPTTRGTTDVQRTLRVLIWFGLFLVLGVITLGVSFVLGLVQTWLGMAALAAGGLFTLTIPPGHGQSLPLRRSRVQAPGTAQDGQVHRCERAREIVGHPVPALLPVGSGSD